MARQSLREFKQDHTDGVVTGTAFTPGSGENTPAAKKRRGDQSTGENGMHHLDSKNAGVEPGKSPHGSRSENKRPADKDGAFYEPQHKLDSKSSGLEQGRSPYSKDVGGSDATKDPMHKLDSKSSGLEPRGYSEDLSPDEKLDAIIEQLAGLNEEEVELVYSQLMEDEGPEDPEDDDDEEWDEDEDELPSSIEEVDLKVTAEDLNIDGALGNIFEGSELTEDFKTKAYGVFEAVVLTVVNSILEERNDQLEENYILALESAKQDLAQTVDDYLETIVENWEEENEIGLTAGIKSEVMEDFIAGLKVLFAEHYVEIPEEKVDLIDELESRVESMEDSLNEHIETNIALRDELNAFKREAIIFDVCENLTDLETEKVREFAENVTFVDEDDFAKRVEAIVETHVAKPTDTKKAPKDDTFDNLPVGEDVPSHMQQIVEAINKSQRPFSMVRSK